MAISDNSERSLVTRDDGREVWEYPNGMQLDAASGKIARPPQHTLMDSERASELSLARWRKAQAAARQGLIRGVRGSQSALEAWAGIIAARANEAREGEGRAATEAARFVGQAAGFFGKQPAEGVGGPARAGATLTMDADTAMRVVEAVLAERQRRAAGG